MKNTFAAVSVKTIAGMAFRNLSRHKIKTIITTVAVAVSVAVYIVMDGWLLGINLDSRRNIVSYETGAAKIQAHLYFEKKDDLPMYENFSGWQEYASILAEKGYDSAPRFVFTGTIYSPTGSAPMEFVGADPAAEERLLRYSSYMESGRYIKPGAFEIAVGSMAAEKLRVGIPQRPAREELEQDIAGYASDEAERGFILSLYENASKDKTAFEGADEKTEERMTLRQDLSAGDLSRFWDILAAGGRMDVRISTVIDMKAIPDVVRREKFEAELEPSLSSEERELFFSVYEEDPFTGDYLLASEDSALLQAALNAMVRADYSGTISHVNQLVDAVVVGVINSPNPKTNANIGYIPLDVLQDESGLMLEGAAPGGAVTELLIRERNAKDTVLPGKSESPEAITAALNAGLAERFPRERFPRERLPWELGVYGWRDYAADYLAASSADNVTSQIMIGLLFILSFIGIANTMLMAILERTREIGMLRAQGMTDGQLIMAYMLEAGFVGLIGSAAGILIGCLVNIPMVQYGIDYSGMVEAAGGDFGYRLTSFFRSAWNPPVIAGTGIVATLLSSVMAFFPTRRALRMPITDSLRFE
ncbi:MAG: FtsX-like permease family protein [Spirochaetaceae bacterium]|jgi:ABC-type lipoprotein release transport system permease subunit|nr:FtsX-like permease family protein [Spirochaetaceae bacterium]